MYTTCMYCKKPLGSNEVVETFPVGRRLAFDAAKGRLWVVCRKCERWNLTPLEERWEAVENCETLFRGTRIRTSSENIGLARHPEGLELVRIGNPLRPEFAAWRYGDQFGRRRRRTILNWGAAGVGLAGGVALAGAAGGAAGAGLAFQGVNIANLWNSFRPTVYFRPEDGRLRWMNRRGAYATRIRSSGKGVPFRVQVKGPMGSKEWFEGDDALRVLRAVLPGLNVFGGTDRTVQSAVSEIGHHRHAQGFLEQVAGHGGDHRYRGVPGYVVKLPKPLRLALEMALHEEDERRALEGELWRLEQAWREAEEIAAIADDLLLPQGASDFVASHGADAATRATPSRLLAKGSADTKGAE